MADVTKEISVLIRLRGGAAFQAEAGAVSRSIKNIGKAADDDKLKSLSNTFNKWGNSLMGLGRSLLPVSAGIAGIGYESAKAANTFQKNMTLLVTQANMPRKAVQGLTKDIMELSRQVGQTPTDLAAAAYWPASGGPGQQRQLASILKYASMGAGIGQDSVDENAKAMSQIMSTGYYANSPKALMSLMDTVVGQGHMHMSDLMEMTGTGIVPVLKSTGMSLKQLYATIAALTSTGVSPTSAASRLRLTFSSMVSPTKAGATALSQVGLNQYALANDLRRGGLIQAVQDMMTHGQEAGYGQNQMNTLISSVFSRSRGWASISSVMDMLPRIQQILKLEGAGNGKRFDQHWSEYTHTFGYQLKQLEANLQAAMIPMGNIILADLIPVLKSLGKFAGSVSKWFQGLSPHTQKLIVKVAALVAIVGPGLIVVGSFFKLIKGTLDALDGLLGLLSKLKPILTFLDTLIFGEDGITAILDMEFGEMALAVAFTLGIFLLLIAAVVAAVAIVWVFRKQIWDAVKWVVHVLTDIFVGAIKGGVTVLKFLWKLFTDLANAVKKVIGWFGHLGGSLVHAGGHMLSGAAHSLFGWIPGLATGGTVTGSGLTLVGEQGPELLNLPRGATVMPLPGNGLASLGAALAGSSGGINLTTNVILDGKVVATSVAKVYRSANNRK